MQSENDRIYYSTRVAQERAFAERATDPLIRKLHTELATRYEQLSVGEYPANFGSRLQD